MKEFDDWRALHFTELKGFSDISGKGVVKSQQEMLKEAFKAGMLVAAEISELAKEFILPADDLADLIAKQIREYADDD